MALLGAEMLLYPTAIGTFAVPPDQIDGEPDDYDHWQNVMLGHAAANMTPVIASNRIGVEEMGGTAVSFSGEHRLFPIIAETRSQKQTPGLKAFLLLHSIWTSWRHTEEEYVHSETEDRISTAYS